MLITLQVFGGVAWGLAATKPSLLLAACIAYFTAAVLLVIARRLHWTSLRIVALVNASVDALAIGFILYASGGVESGLAILLVLPVLALTVLSDRRDALLIAAVGALAVLVQQVFVGLTEGSSASEYVTAGFLGLVLFVVALAMWPVANRLRESEALVRRQELDLENMAQLSQYIVQHLRESILVIDATGSHPPDQRVGRPDAGRRAGVPGRTDRRGLTAPALSARIMASGLHGGGLDACAGFNVRRRRWRASDPPAFRAAG